MISHITILFFAGLREKTNTKETTIQFSTSSISLLDTVKRLIQQYEQLSEIFFPKIPPDQIDEYLGDEVNFTLTRVRFARNRKIIANPTHEIHLTDGDILAIFLPLLGG